MADYIQAGVPISQQQRPESQQASTSPFTPSVMEEDLAFGKFDRRAFDMAQSHLQEARMQTMTPQPQAPVQPQNEAPMQDLNPGFLDKIQERIRAMKEEARVKQQFMAQPEQPRQQYAQPPQPQVPQNEPASQNDDKANEEWLKTLLDGNKQGTQNQPPVDQTQKAPEQTQNSYSLQKDEVERLTGYLEENQKYFNAIELEAKRRGMDPYKIAEALSKKPIHEVVDFAIGNMNIPVQSPPIQQPAMPQYQQAPMQQQRAMPDPVDFGRQNARTSLPPEQPVYGGDKNWGF
jgi:hypothetical protein